MQASGDSRPKLEAWLGRSKIDALPNEKARDRLARICQSQAVQREIRKKVSALELTMRGAPGSAIGTAEGFISDVTKLLKELRNECTE